MDYVHNVFAIWDVKELKVLLALYGEWGWACCAVMRVGLVKRCVVPALCCVSCHCCYSLYTTCTMIPPACPLFA